MKYVTAQFNREIIIGHAGENEAISVVFNLAYFEKHWPDGKPLLLVRRPNDTEAYPVSVEVNDHKCVWLVSSADSAQAGIGECELQWSVGDTVAKSDIYKLKIVESLDVGTEPPEDPEKRWFDKIESEKLDKNQGADNAGKALVIGDDGNVVPGEVQGGSSLPAMSSNTAGKMLTNDGKKAEWTEQDDWSRFVVTVKVIEMIDDGQWSCTADKTAAEIMEAVESGRSVVAVSRHFDGASIPLVNTYGRILFQGVEPINYPTGVINISVYFSGNVTIEFRPFDDRNAIHTYAETLNAAKQAQARTNIGLDQVDNTSDANKPVSTAQEAAIKVVQDALDQYKTDVGNGTVIPARATGDASGNNIVNTYATKQELANLSAVQIRNKDEVINATQETVQTVATAYMVNNYGRQPQNLDGLILTITDLSNDKILYIYSVVSSLWINAGINGVDLSKYVGVAQQTFTDAEKAQARQNIGAGTSSFSGSYNDLADKPTIPTALPNPNALTIKVGDTTTTYDGSAAKTVEIDGGGVTDEQVSSAVSTWLTEHPDATTTVQDGSVSAEKLEGYHVACRDVPWTLFLDGYKTTVVASSEEPSCAIYYVKLESGKTYCISNIPNPVNENEFVTDPSISYFGYYFGYSTLPDVDANVASNRDRLYGYFVTGIINTFVRKAISEGYIELEISGDMPGSVPYYFKVKQDCFLLRASTKPAAGQRVNNYPVAEVLPGMSGIGNGFSGEWWSTFKKDLGGGYAVDGGFVQQIFASKIATAEKQRAYAAMSRDVPRDRTLNIQFIGDSITYAGSNAGLQNAFRKYVSMNLQAQQCTLCQSGVSVTTGGGSFDWNGKQNSSADYNAEMSGYSGLVQKLAEYRSNLSLSVWSDSVDIVVVELGTNDHWEQSALGAQTDLTADTNFYGAVEKTLTLLEETFPHAQVLWLLPFKNQRWKTSTIKLVDYLIALKVICQMHTRCWVLDLTDKWFLDYDDADLRSSFFIDGVHITGAAHKCVAESMIDKIREVVSVCGTRQIETVHTTSANDSVYGSSST